VSAPRVTVFAPSPLITVAIEARPGGGDEIHLHPGGQGVWVARMASALGAHPTLCGFAGGESGIVLRALLPGDARLVECAGPTGTLVADRRGGERANVACSLAGPPSRHEVDALLSTTCAQALDADVAVVCNPYPGEAFPAELYGPLVTDLRDCGIPVLVDLSSPRLDAALVGRPDVVKLNDWELAEYVCGPVDGPRLETAARRLLEHGAGTVVVTRGPEPAVVFPGDGEPLEVVTPRFDAGHREGCGDAMAGAMAAVLGRGGSLTEALRLGAGAGAANFLRRGLGSATADVVEQLAGRVEVRPYAPAGA
jgi:1-phosphofructokinase